MWLSCYECVIVIHCHEKVFFIRIVSLKSCTCISAPQLTWGLYGLFFFRLVGIRYFYILPPKKFCQCVCVSWIHYKHHSMTINQSFVKVADNIGFKFGVIKITRYFTTNLDCDQKCQLFMTEPTQFICYYFCLLGFVSPVFRFWWT